jgi:magnesium transporter
VIRVWRYRIGTPGRELIDGTDVAAVVEPDQAVIWIDAESLDDAERNGLRDQLGIDEAVVDAFTSESQRTKLLRFGGNRFHVAVHDAELTDEMKIETSEIDIVIGHGWVLSVRHPSPRCSPFDIDEVARRFELQWSPSELPEEGFLLWALFDTLSDRYVEASNLIDDRIDELDAEVFPTDPTDQAPDITRRVVLLRRALMELRHAVAPMREILTSLDRKEIPYIEDAVIVYFRDALDRIRWSTDYIESQRDLLTGLLEAQLAIYANRTNDVMKRMTSWGAILLGSTLIAGIYGMNFRHMPELGWELGYPAALGSMVLLTIVLVLWFRHKDWL